MKYLFALSLFIFLGSKLGAQAIDPKFVDSLQQKLAQPMEDSLRGKLNLKLANYYLNAGLGKEARPFIEKALELSTKMNNLKALTLANNLMGNTYFYTEDYEQAEKYWKIALDLAIQRQDQAMILSIKGDMANALTAQGKYPEALNTYYELLANAEKKGDSSKVALALSNAAIVYSLIGENQKGISMLQRAIPILRNEKDYFRWLASLQTLGNLYESTKEYQKSLDVFTEAKGIAEAQEMKDFLPIIYQGMGLACQQMHRYGAAYECLQKSYQAFMEMGEEQSLDAAITQETLGSLYYDIAMDPNSEALVKFFGGNKNKALLESQRLIEKSIKVFEEYEDLENLKAALETLSSTERALGQFEKALTHFERFQVLSDSLFNLEKDKKIAQREMQYTFDKKEAMIRSEQEKKIIQQRIIRNAALITLFGALIFGFVVFRQRNKIAKEQKRSEELLLNILPKEVAEELKTKGEAEAKLINDATVLFTDFKGFTELSEKLTPKELIQDLNECFTAFDNIIQKYGLEKIKTIGDSYMAAGGLPTPKATHAEDMVHAALEIRNFIENGKAKRMAKGATYFEIRIGVHTGPVVAGIVGVKKFSYDIWGDTVNTASRLETSGETGKVNISETTYKLVKDKFNCTYRGKIQAKHKGEMHMYFVEELETPML
jgi:class 3 adenylate cyclase